MLRETHPTAIAFPHPLDRHPDHRATGLFTLLAIREWAGGGAPLPRLLAFLVHWPGWPQGWDAETPAPGATERPLTLPEDLPQLGLARATLALSPHEVATKAAALDRYVTQREVMRAFLAAYVRSSEPFTLFTAEQVRDVESLIERPGGPG